MKRAWILGMGVLAASACGGGSKEPSKYPPRPEGCDVSLFHGTPTMQTDNIGPVSAICSDDVKEDDCIRTLKDEACKLGGDVVWEVPDKPTRTNSDKNRWTGRAAHSK